MAAILCRGGKLIWKHEWGFSCHKSSDMSVGVASSSFTDNKVVVKFASKYTLFLSQNAFENDFCIVTAILSFYWGLNVFNWNYGKD